jgi:Putative Ig domain
MVFLLSGCMGGDNGTTGASSGTGNHAPTIRGLSILPSPVTLAGLLTVRVEAQDLDSDIVKFRYRWFVNGKVISGQTAETLPPTLLKRGDQLTVEATPFDGTIDGAPYMSAPVPIVNTAPILSSLSVDFDHAVQGRQLLARVEVLDADRDEVSLSYRWRKNETVVKEGEDSTLSVAGLTPRDVVDVDVTASDGNANGTATLSGRFTMSNSSPTILSNPSVSTTGGVYEYLVQASDPDGDPITYTLEEAPPGMSIGEQTGRIHWSVTPEAKGIYRIKVVAQDNKGGFAAQDFELSITAPPKAS